MDIGFEKIPTNHQALKDYSIKLRLFTLKQQERIAQLENKNQNLKEDRKWFIGRIKELEKKQAIRDLEQQARACCWIYSNVLDLSFRNHVAIQYRDTELRNQAKKLEEKDK